MLPPGLALSMPLRARRGGQPIVQDRQAFVGGVVACHTGCVDQLPDAIEFGSSVEKGAEVNSQALLSFTSLERSFASFARSCLRTFIRGQRESESSFLAMQHGQRQAHLPDCAGLRPCLIASVLAR